MKILATYLQRIISLWECVDKLVVHTFSTWSFFKLMKVNFCTFILSCIPFLLCRSYFCLDSVCGESGVWDWSRVKNNFITHQELPNRSCLCEPKHSSVQRHFSISKSKCRRSLKYVKEVLIFCTRLWARTAHPGLQNYMPRTNKRKRTYQSR